MNILYYFVIFKMFLRICTSMCQTVDFYSTLLDGISVL